MKIPKRLLNYFKNNLTEVQHTTLNPKGPGAVRIHLIPPKVKDGEIAAGVAIINGQDIIPVNVAWMVLLTEFIREVNVYHGKELSDSDVKQIINRTCKNVSKVFPIVPKSFFKHDISTIMHTFTQIAYGEVPDEEISYVNIGDYADFMGAPHRMDLMVSAMEKDGNWNCNQKCIHCYAKGQNLSSEPELTTDRWKEILDILRENCVPQVTFTGGEPTMREDLLELIEYAAWFVTRLNTNGIKLTEEYCKKLYDASLDSVQITFYSKDEEIHNRLVGAKQYSACVEGIENALKAGLNVSINTPLCTANADYVETLKFLKEKGITYVTTSGLILTGAATKKESEDLTLDKERLKEILKEAVAFCNENEMEINFTSPGLIEPLFFKELNLRAPSCGACLSNMAITPSGKVVPCQSWLTGPGIGNILENEWDSIWNSKPCVIRRNYSAAMTGECPLKIRREKEREEEERRAEEAKRAEEERKAEEAKRAEEERKAEEAKKEEEAKKAEEKKKATDKKLAKAALKAQRDITGEDILKKTGNRGGSKKKSKGGKKK